VKCPKCGTVFIGNKCPKCGYEPTEYDIAIDTLMQLTGVGKKRAEELYNAGFKDIKSIANENEDSLASVHGIGHELAKKIIKDAKEMLSENEENASFVRICQVCGAIIPPGMNKCPQCGTPVKEPEEEAAREKTAEGEDIEKIEDMAICPFCGALIPKESHVCPVCGAELKNVPLEEPQPMEDPLEVLKKFFGVSEIPEYHEDEENVDVRVCPNCGAIVVNRDTCPLCGARVPPAERVKKEEEIELSETLNLCPNCGAIVPPDATVCPVCGGIIEQKQEVEISMGELLNAAHDEISEEELTEIAQALAEKEEPIEIKAEDMEKLMSAVAVESAAQEISESELEEIRQSIENKDQHISEEKIEEKIKPEPTPAPEPLPPPSEKTEQHPEILTPSEKLNNLLYNFGSREDILSFTPLMVALLYLTSGGFLSGTSLTVLTKTVSIVLFFIGSLFAIETYLTVREFSTIEKIIGILFAFIPALTLLPYVPALYATVLVSGAMIFIKSRRDFDYWIPFTTSVMSFALHMGYCAHYSVMFAAMFGVHIIARYERINLPLPAEEGFNDPRKLINEGMEAFRNKNYYDAIYLLRKAIRYGGEKTTVLNTLGLAYGRIGNTEMAINTFKRIIEIDPKFKYAWNNLGNVYARNGDYEEAIKCYRNALKIDPNYDDALLNLGYVMIRRGKYDEAVKIAGKIKATI